MIFKKIIFFLASALLLSCGSKKIKLEKNSLVKFEKAFYSKYNSGIKSGNSGVNIHLTSQNKGDEINLKGIYFKKGYSDLKYESPNIYTAFVVTSYGKKDGENFYKNKEKMDKSKEEIKFPFPIEDNEAVLVCTIKEKKKYFKILLEKKDVGIPQ